MEDVSGRQQCFEQNQVVPQIEAMGFLVDGNIAEQIHALNVESRVGGIKGHGED